MMTSEINVESMQPVGHFLRASEKAPLEISELIKLQHEFMSDQEWGGRFREVYLSYNYADVLGIFLVEFSELMNKGIDKYVWTIVGDVPHAYMVVDHAKDYREALLLYCDLMEEWIEAVISGRRVGEDIYPVEASPTHENADALATRINFIRNEVIS